jgi:hypothetical protein
VFLGGWTTREPARLTGIVFAPRLYVVEKLPLTRATWDAYERVLNSGVTLPAPDRVSAMTTEAGPTHSQLVVAVVSVETYSEVRVVGDLQRFSSTSAHA